MKQSSTTMVKLMVKLSSQCFLPCRTLYHTDLSPRWTRSGGQYTLLPNLGTDKSGLQLGREGQWAIREGRYKYIDDGGATYLYDVVADPREENPFRDGPTAERLRRKLYSWWQNMLDDNGSFTTPSFYVGYPGFKSGVILASAAAERNGGWSLREHYISGRVQSGQYLKYNVIIASAGGYEIKVCEG